MGKKLDHFNWQGIVLEESLNDTILSNKPLIFRYVFKHSKKIYNGVPIVASNMDTVGTFEMAKTLAGYNMFTTIHKHYTVDEWVNFANGINRDPEVCSGILRKVYRLL